MTDQIKTNRNSSAFSSFRGWIVAVCLAGALLPLHAADEVAIPVEPKETPVEPKHYLPWDKGAVRFGGFLTAFDSEIGFGVGSVGVTLNAEDLLNLDSTLTVFRVDALYRPGKSRRNQLDFTFSSYDRTGGATLERDLTIGSITYPAGAQVKTIFDFDIIRGTYTYAFLQDDRMRIAGGLGVYALPIKYGLTIDTGSGGSRVEGADTTLPLPAFALRADFQLIPKLFLNTGIDAMYLEIDEFKGSLLDVNVALEYQVWKHFGIGLGYNALSIAVEGSESSNYPGVNFEGNVDVRYSGLMLYGKLSF